MPLAKDIMKEVMDALHPDHSVAEAVVRMKRDAVSFLPVTDGDRLVGILRAHDLYFSRRERRKGGPPKQVRDIMATDFAFCFADDDIETARLVMEESGHRHLLVVNAERQLVGVLTLEALLQNRASRQYKATTESKTLRDMVERRRVSPAKNQENMDPKDRASYSVRPQVKK